MFDFRVRHPIKRVAILGNHLPRQCGIATFTADLADALAEVDPEASVECIAMNDRHLYAYPDRVRRTIEESDEAAYSKCADLLNRADYDVLSIQHEYGIFGGVAGSYLLSLVRNVRMPVVTTLHTVLREPTDAQRHVLSELIQYSERLVVMSKKATDILGEVHSVPADKIDLIHHGIPVIPEDEGKAFRATLGVEGPMLLTFGLLSPDKGIQYVIEAMSDIVKKYPQAAYFVVGATHPHVRASGDSYRESLYSLVRDLGLEKSVHFIDRFVTKAELVRYLGAMDIYVTPYTKESQITSGTLAYALGTGKPVISTSYWYADELLSEGRGISVAFRDSKQIASAVMGLQSDPDARAAMGRRAAIFARDMLWPQVAGHYLQTFARARRDSASRLRSLTDGLSRFTLPGIVTTEQRYKHLQELSDDTGILQHATFTLPKRSEGYCVDDNARALLLTTYLEGEAALSPEHSLLQSRYLSFVLDAYNPAEGRFRNFMSYDRKWLEAKGSEDSNGRALWSLGAASGRCRDRGRRDAARALFRTAIPSLLETTSPRTWAYGLLGIHEYLGQNPGDSRVAELQRALAERLVGLYDFHAGEDWPWFEDALTYANARLPQALLLAGEDLDRSDMQEIALKALAWLMEVQTGPGGVFTPIGTNGFFRRGCPRAYFDQQPIEAWASLSACIDAHHLTGNPLWYGEAQCAFQWFMGQNMLGQPLFDGTSGGCHDGLHEDRINRNQGAESTLSFLAACAEMRTRSLPSERPSKHEVR